MRSFSGAYFPAFGLHTDIYRNLVNLCFSTNTVKYGPEKLYIWTLFTRCSFCDFHHITQSLILFRSYRLLFVTSHISVRALARVHISWGPFISWFCHEVTSFNVSFFFFLFLGVCVGGRLWIMNDCDVLVGFILSLLKKQNQ